MLFASRSLSLRRDVCNFQLATMFSQPLEVREIGPDRCYKACQLGVWSVICNKRLQGIVKLAAGLESGRFVARDIGKSQFSSFHRSHALCAVRVRASFLVRERRETRKASVASFRLSLPPARRRNKPGESGGRGKAGRRKSPAASRDFASKKRDLSFPG